MLNRFFGNSREKLVLSLLDDDGISAEELARLRDAIQSASPAREAIPEAAANKKRSGREECR